MGLDKKHQTRSVPKLIYIMGIDGSGKSTAANALAEGLRQEGFRVDVLWLRFNNVLSKPLLAFCRLIGLTRREIVGGVLMGFHDFYRSRIISWLFVFLQYLDALRVRWLTLQPKLSDPNRVVILDRYVYDILVDLIVDTHLYRLHAGPAGKAFARLLPPWTRVVACVRPTHELVAARPESGQDPNFPLRLLLYEKIFSFEGVETLCNDGSKDDFCRQIIKLGGLAKHD